jgi:hypothetical protein
MVASRHLSLMEAWKTTMGCVRTWSSSAEGLPLSVASATSSSAWVSSTLLEMWEVGAEYDFQTDQKAREWVLVACSRFGASLLGKSSRALGRMFTCHKLVYCGDDAVAWAWKKICGRSKCSMTGMKQPRTEQHVNGRVPRKLMVCSSCSLHSLLTAEVSREGGSTVRRDLAENDCGL